VSVTRSKPTVFVVPHSHFDPEWILTYQQYLRRERTNLKMRLQLLQLEPHHVFCASEEMATLPLLQESDSRLCRDFREAVKRGQIEVKGAVASGELMMHAGESIARQFTLGKHLLERALRIRLDVVVAQNIDNYALCPQLPQILRQCGRRYLLIGVYQDGRTGTQYAIDPSSARPELWWRGPDGSSVLTVLSKPDYSGIGPRPQRKRALHVVHELMNVASRRAIFVFSGGDMAPPDPQLPAKLEKWSGSGSNGQLRMAASLPRRYFEALVTDPSVPVGQVDAITDHLGAFESRVRARQTSRRAECLLLTAEKAATAAWLLTGQYPHDELDRAWFGLLINHQHDPALACLRDSLMTHVMKRYRRVEEVARRVLEHSLASIAAGVVTNGAPGDPVVVFSNHRQSRWNEEGP